SETMQFVDHHGKVHAAAFEAVASTAQGIPQPGTTRRPSWGCALLGMLQNSTDFRCSPRIGESRLSKRRWKGTALSLLLIAPASARGFASLRKA
ncbi:MAG TPA: hypothetical protein VIE66_12775, partial [Methylocella sp.]